MFFVLHQSYCSMATDVVATVVNTRNCQLYRKFPKSSCILPWSIIFSTKFGCKRSRNESDTRENLFSCLVTLTAIAQANKKLRDKDSQTYRQTNIRRYTNIQTILLLLTPSHTTKLPNSNRKR